MRPHHHAAIFGYDFPDRELWSIRDGVRLYRSAILEKLWPFGFCTIGDVTYESAAYIARYCMKKITGKKSETHYQAIDFETGEIYKLLPEYITMSRKPGLARDWFDKYKSDAYPKDFITYQGRKHPVPKFYDKIYDIEYPEKFMQIKKIRVEKAEQNADNNTWQRLKARKTVAASKIKQLVRRYEK